MSISHPSTLAMPFLTLTANPAIGAVLLDSRPAWVWNEEGNRILWSNRAGLDFFSVDSMHTLLDRRFGDVHPARRHLARLARNARAEAPILDRLRFFLGETTVTTSCLCKRLQVEGETVLLVIATERTGENHSCEENARYLVESLAADGGIAAAFVDSGGQPWTSAGEEDDSLKGHWETLFRDQGRLHVMIAESNTPLRLAACTILADEPQGDGQGDRPDPLAALVRIGEEQDRHYLVLLHRPDNLDEQMAENLHLLTSAFDDGTDGEPQALSSAEISELFPDIFNEDVDHPHPGADQDLHRDSDVKPFLFDDHSKGFSGTEHLGSGSAPVRLVTEATDHGADDPKVVHLTVGSDKPQTDSRVTLGHETEQADQGGEFRFDGTAGPCHFIWESDEVGRFTLVSDDLAKAVGPAHAALVGKDWPEIADWLTIDDDRKVDQAFQSRDTWAGLTVYWPVEGHDLIVPIELTGLPVFGRYHGFQGFRGFGVCHINRAQTAPIDEKSDQSGPNAPFETITTPQFDARSELLSDELLQVARTAVATTEAVISPVSGDDGAADTDRNAPEDKVTAVSEEPRDPHEEATGGEDKTVDEAQSHSATKRLSLARNPYDLVTSLLQPPEPGCEEEPSSETSEETGSSPEMDDSHALSLGERSAFDSIAAALMESARPRLDDRDEMDDDYEEPVLIDDEEDEGDADRASVTALSEEAATLLKEQNVFDFGETPTAPKTPEVSPPEPSRQAPKRDTALRSATSAAFQEIMVLDPIFRSLRERSAGLNHAGAEETAPEDKAPADLIAEDATPEEPAASTPVDEDDAHVATSEDAPDEPQDESSIEGKDDADEELSVRDQVDDIESPAPVDEDDDSEDTSEPAEPMTIRESSMVLAAATVAGVAALEDSSLWDRKTDSPLIDLLNKIPTAILVSANSEILFASRKALRDLGYESAATLEEAGGMEGLFTGRPGDWLTKTDGRTTLRGADHAHRSVLACISSINWGDKPAAMLTFEPAPDTAPGTGVSEEDEKIAELEAILDTATDGVVVMDETGHILRMNHSAEALFEVDRHEVAGNSFLDLIMEESHKDVLDYLERLKNNSFASLLNDGRDIIGRVPSGGMIPLFITLGRVAIPGTNRFCAVLRDVTEWKRTEETIISEKLRAETASKQKSEFLTRVSHEIRTPLNAILGFSEVMMEEQFGPIGSERYKDYLKDISVSGNHIMALLNDIMDLSKVESGKLDLNFEATPLNRLVAEGVGIMQPQANREQIIIRTSLASSLPQIAGDDRSLRQVVLNLLSNALKFTPAGGQVIVSTLQEESGDVVLRIRDTGIGMNEEDIQSALEPFRQLASNRQNDGIGLGLPLTKALVEANRGRLRLSSKEKHGTLVEVSFPKQRVIETDEESEEAETLV